MHSEHDGLLRLTDHWARALGAVASIESLEGGLVNRTYRVDASAGQFILQWVNPVFADEIHGNIRAVTRAVRDAGLATPELLDTDAGPVLARDGGDRWRLWTFLPGRSFSTFEHAHRASSAGLLVGRFHAAMANLRHEFVGMREGVHDTPRHLQRLDAALALSPGHRLEREVQGLARELLASHATLAPLPELPPMVGHGDLKLDNLRFDASGENAYALLDLDTVGPLALAHELGDMWRSWCNRAGEDGPHATEQSIDHEVLAASMRGYREGLGRSLSTAERDAISRGPTWISLELAARFLTDAIEERYFGWDSSKFPARGEHNLARASRQLALHLAFRKRAKERRAIIDALAS